MKQKHVLEKLVSSVLGICWLLFKVLTVCGTKDPTALKHRFLLKNSFLRSHFRTFSHIVPYNPGMTPTRGVHSGYLFGTTFGTGFGVRIEL